MALNRESGSPGCDDIQRKGQDAQSMRYSMLRSRGFTQHALPRCFCEHFHTFRWFHL